MLGRTQQACRYSTTWSWCANKQQKHTHNMFYIHKYFYNSGGYFEIGPTIFRCCMVLVKKSAACKLAYNRAYLAIFLADACRQSALKFKRTPKGHENKKHFYMQNFPSIVFQMFSLFKILLKVCKMWAQTASSSTFPTDAFLLKLIGIDVQQAEGTRKHILERFEIYHQFYLTTTSMQTLWHLSRLKQRICFAFMPVISNALKSKCRFQSQDSEYKILLVVAQ